MANVTHLRTTLNKRMAHLVKENQRLSAKPKDNGGILSQCRDLAKEL